jgi:DNA replication protein DnaC
MKIESLKQALMTLHLKTMAEMLEEILKQGERENLSAADILSLLASQEMAAREQRRVKTRVAQANFPVLKTLDAFDFAFPKSINKSQILSLFDLHFVEKKDNAILMGPPGTGKTHIGLALLCGAPHNRAYGESLFMLSKLPLTLSKLH